MYVSKQKFEPVNISKSSLPSFGFNEMFLNNPGQTFDVVNVFKSLQPNIRAIYFLDVYVDFSSNHRHLI